MTKHIAVIDDSLTVRKLLEVSLGREGYSVVSWGNTKDAFRVLFSPHEIHPDLLLVDLHLPSSSIDGIEVIKQARGNLRYVRTPIFVISAKDGVLDRLKARLAGANEYITKPFKVQEIVELAKRYL